MTLLWHLNVTLQCYFKPCKYTAKLKRQFTVTGAELGQCVWWDGRGRGSILRGGADLGERLISFLHWTHLLCRLNSAAGQQMIKLENCLILLLLCIKSSGKLDISPHRWHEAHSYTCYTGRTAERVWADHGSGWCQEEAGPWLCCRSYGDQSRTTASCSTPRPHLGHSGWNALHHPAV